MFGRLGHRPSCFPLNPATWAAPYFSAVPCYSSAPNFTTTQFTKPLKNIGKNHRTPKIEANPWQWDCGRFELNPSGTWRILAGSQGAILPRAALEIALIVRFSSKRDGGFCSANLWIQAFEADRGSNSSMTDCFRGCDGFSIPQGIQKANCWKNVVMFGICEDLMWGEVCHFEILAWMFCDDLLVWLFLVWVGFVEWRLQSVKFYVISAATTLTLFLNFTWDSTLLYFTVHSDLPNITHVATKVHMSRGQYPCDIERIIANSLLFTWMRDNKEL